LARKIERGMDSIMSLHIQQQSVDSRRSMMEQSSRLAGVVSF
jgi:hypothetical protein